MTDEQQQEQAPEVDLNAEFAAGFSNDAPREEPKQEAAEEPTPEVQQESPPQEPPPPETVSITKEQWQAMQQRLSEVDTLKQEMGRRIDQTFGRIGEIQRTLQQQPKGLQLSKDKFKRLGNDFPELATLLAEDLSEALGATAPQEQPVPQAPSIDPNALKQELQSQFEQRLRDQQIELEKKALNRRHKDWQQVVVSEDFNRWGQTQLAPQEWIELRASNDADVVADAIDRFRAYREQAQAAARAAAEKANKRQSASKRLEAAITPTGTAGSVPKLTERDLFLQGFSSP